MSSFDEKKDIYVHLPCDTVDDDELLRVFQIIAADYKFYEFYMRVAREQQVQLAGGRLWPTVITNDEVKALPSFYIYLIAVEQCENGDRFMTIGIIHWLFGIYADLELYYRVYPESFKHQPEWKNTPIYLPSVTFGDIDFNLDYTEHQQLRPSEARSFVAGVVDTLITFTCENCEKAYESVAVEFEKDHGMCVSKRLIQVMLYHQKLVHRVQDWVIKSCGCSRNEQVCHCGLYTQLDIVKCKQLYFKDAGLLVSDAVYFTSPG
ncbi:Hypothetical predicted protein [Paramuricea clavata]|uniref:Uncharacterized protein n=1 Tax=Paramuricea clavata TaxID=317549 RepID=A0A6S7HGR3_PARCT|nr:Hypothetical predicted protein [Paramuricea clavata]